MKMRMKKIILGFMTMMIFLCVCGKVEAAVPGDTVTLCFDANGGSVEIDERPVVIGENYEDAYGDLPVPEKEGYSFKGWYDDKNNEFTKSTVISVDTDSFIITACWEPISYMVNLDTGLGVSLSIQVIYESTYEKLEGVKFTKTLAGHTFDGWYTSESGGTKITAATKVTRTDSHTLYARWKKNEYTITFNSMGGNTVASKAVLYEAAYGTLPTPVRAGYTFVGWYDAKTGGNLVGANTICRNNVTLYACWKKDVVPQPQKLGAISGVKVERKANDATKAVVSWNAVKNAEKYIVEYSKKKASGYKKVKTITNVNQKIFKVTKTKLKRGEKGYFRITAYRKESKKIKVISYTVKPNQLKISCKAKEDVYRFSWKKLEKGIAGIEIRKNNKPYASARGGSYRYYDMLQKNAPKGTKIKIRTYFQNGKKKVYSEWTEKTIK